VSSKDIPALRREADNLRRRYLAAEEELEELRACTDVEELEVLVQVRRARAEAAEAATS
jgi:hypothetical protein